MQSKAGISKPSLGTSNVGNIPKRVKNKIFQIYFGFELASDDVIVWRISKVRILYCYSILNGYFCEKKGKI